MRFHEKWIPTLLGTEGGDDIIVQVNKDWPELADTDISRQIPD